MPGGQDRAGAVIGWKLDRAERASLLERFPPRWPDVVADHVTLEAGVPIDAVLPNEMSGAIIGVVDDDAGVEAMVVRIGGGTDRPDGSTYHITWSLDRDRGRRAIESNDVLAGYPWRIFPEPIPLTLVPARWSASDEPSSHSR